MYEDTGGGELSPARFDRRGLTHRQATFRDHRNTGRVRGYNYLPTLCAARPVHVVWGAVDDYMYVARLADQ